MDKVFIEDLLIRGVIGVSERERANKQDIVVSVVMYADITKGAETDDIHYCVNYRTVAKAIIAHVESTARYTVEALANDIAAICLDMDGVQKVEVKVEKPGAVRFSRSVGVQITREKQDGN
ncbi:MAG: 7,8-dihydroneopterin aldolase/epimerase/oxygenase [Chloroflexota bacterium]|nr:7,8-dihydroneopterin aldolase/epimerase/oxygenase [Chloroflexota bacterium]